MSLLEEPPGWMRPLLHVGESLYGAAIAVRRAAYGVGLLERKRAARPVISVGNLAAGGTGKTPFVIFLAQRLAASNLRVAVLSRGYRRRDERALVVVSEGHGPLAPAEEAGDEPVLIAARTSALVIACADRVRAAALAVERYDAQILILDDGFQHWRLERDLDVVLLDKTDPLANGHLLPRGPLREPAASLVRADLLVLVGDGEAHSDSLPERPTVEVSVAASHLTLGPDRHPPEMLRGRRVALISGIARPERFRRTLERLGAIVVHEERRPDHAPLGDLDRFLQQATQAGAELCLTTEKDAARLGLTHMRSELGVLVVEHRIMRGEALLDAALAKVIA